jgi:hypothetical protein
MSQQQQYVQPPVVVLPQARQTNGLGVFGFLVALVGLFVPTGIIAMLGLILCLIALGRGPRFLAGLGVLIGLIGTIGWLGVMIFGLFAAVVALIGVGLFSAVAFAVTQPEVVEVTSDMMHLTVVAEQYRDEHGAMPENLAALGLGVATLTDPWGREYRLVPIDEEPGFDIVSLGPDGTIDSDDDIRLTSLDRVWEVAFEEFGETMEDLGEKMEAMDRCGQGPCVRFSCDADRDWSPPQLIITTTGRYAQAYEEAAVREIESQQDDADGR